MKVKDIQGDEIWDVVCICGHPRSVHFIGVDANVAKGCSHSDEGNETDGRVNPCKCELFEPRTVQEAWT